MDYISTFRRSEVKYLITPEQRDAVTRSMSEFTERDKYGISLVKSIYYDTPDKLLIRRSLEKPMYKEKLRLRSYGQVTSESEVFVELKKKYDGIVYKRCAVMSCEDAEAYLAGQIPASQPSQITRELDRFLLIYPDLEPSVLISYRREAFASPVFDGFRVTFDDSILWRESDLSPVSGTYGRPLLRGDEILMELKIPGAMPLPMARILSENKIYKTTFSKYGCAYREMHLRCRVSNPVYA